LFAATVLFFVTAKKKNRPELGWRVWDITLCCAILSLGFKLAPLPRPDGGPHGFPSGHCLTAFAVSCLLMRKFPKLSQYAFAIAVAVGWSRVEIREHFVYQVLFGAIFGIVVGLAVALAEDNLGVLLPRLLRGRKREPDLPDAALRLLGRASRSSSED
jgi:membrane-associated phospholipid phosphatase